MSPLQLSICIVLLSSLLFYIFWERGGKIQKIVYSKTGTRYTRSAILDTLNKPFVTVLRAKGLSERKILFRHVIKNS